MIANPTESPSKASNPPLSKGRRLYRYQELILNRAKQARSEGGFQGFAGSFVRSRLAQASAVLILIVLIFFSWWYVNWSAKGIITGSGGLYFFSPTILQVPAFSQDDPQWQNIELGPSQDTIGTAGCALCSAAMVMRFYGLDTDPARLNEYLSFHQGYTPEGWIYWEKAAALSSGHVEKVYEDAPSYQLIDENLLLSNPVIVRLHLSSGTTHFVVVVGKSGWDYLIRDPAAMEMGVYKLALRSNEVTGLRYYASH